MGIGMKENVYIWFWSCEKGTTQGKLYIIGKKKIPSFEKYIVFHVYYGDIYLVVIMISLIFLSTLVPFSHDRNHLWMGPYSLVDTSD